MRDRLHEAQGKERDPARRAALAKVLAEFEMVEREADLREDIAADRDALSAALAALEPRMRSLSARRERLEKLQDTTLAVGLAARVKRLQTITVALRAERDQLSSDADVSAKPTQRLVTYAAVALSAAGFSHREISKLTKVDVGAIRVRLSRARQRAETDESFRERAKREVRARLRARHEK